jgi:hypothetical protein
MPAWANQAHITVTDDAAGERVVTASMQLAPAAFSVQDVRQLPQALANQQGSLISSGANIGRTIVRINDINTGDPLYLTAEDRLWSFRLNWKSPLVMGLAPLIPEAGIPSLPASPPAASAGSPPAGAPRLP